ncbi:hypothetical protein QG37_07503 [Candidozyma auris]|nr:hypothetical protein QG37_07503 [[Candida] auris]
MLIEAKLVIINVVIVILDTWFKSIRDSWLGDCSNRVIELLGFLHYKSFLESSFWSM